MKSIENRTTQDVSWFYFSFMNLPTYWWWPDGSMWAILMTTEKKGSMIVVEKVLIFMKKIHHLARQLDLRDHKISGDHVRIHLTRIQVWYLELNHSGQMANLCYLRNYWQWSGRSNCNGGSCSGQWRCCHGVSYITTREYSFSEMASSRVLLCHILPWSDWLKSSCDRRWWSDSQSNHLPSISWTSLFSCETNHLQRHILIKLDRMNEIKELIRKMSNFFLFMLVFVLYQCLKTWLDIPPLSKIDPLNQYWTSKKWGDLSKTK